MSAPEILNGGENKFRPLSATFGTKIKASQEPAEGGGLQGIPTWLTRTYVEDCLRSHYNDDTLKVLQIQAMPALGKGENYGAVLTRLKAEFTMAGANTSRTGSFIVKSAHEGDALVRRIMESYDLFNCEMSIYERVLPKLKALLKGIGDEERIFAETVAVDRERSALIFEDLTDCHFVMPDRLQGLDMSLIKLILRKLAKMHAASAVLNEHEEGCLEVYNHGMFNRHTEENAPCFLSLLEACSRRVVLWPGFESLSAKLLNMKPVYMELGKRVFDPLPSHLNVLAHGDLWTNNVLVKYDAAAREPVDVIIIDFQYSSWGSPAIDLFYLFNTSLQEDLHYHRQDELIQFYYQTLTETLGKLIYKGPVPSLHRFHMQLEEKLFYAFHSTCIVRPIQRTECTADADIRALMETNERALNFKNNCYRNPNSQKVIKHLLPIYERKGLLEVDQ